ncbi:MAG: hypothetical protein LQ350_005408 [Teloschistes chrysophthalmus]|nr:MAG: hypothetical protein LQ350_005408 [Niorma chrysophthalma]
MALSVIGIPIEESSHFSNPLYERQTATAGLPLECNNRIADGGPQGSAFRHWQVTENIDCGTDGCSVGKLKSHTFGIEAGIGGFSVENVPVPVQFGVTKSWTSGETYTCDGKGEKVCVWLKVAYTTFKAKWNDGPSCSGNRDPGELTFPNKNNEGGDYYCVRGDTCRSMDANYWE